MRITLLGPYPAVAGQPRGGVETLMESLAGALAALGGHHVNVIDPFTAGPEIAPTDTLAVRRLPLISPRQMMRRTLPATVRDAVAESRPDVLHVHLAAQAARVHTRSVVTVHGFPHLESRLRHPGLRGRARAALLAPPFVAGLRAAAQVVAISPEVTALAAGLGINAVEIPNAVHGSFFELERQPGADFVCVGDIMRRKNQAFLVEAFARHVERGEDGNLLLVGSVTDEAYGEECHRLAEPLGDRVLFLGSRTRAEVSDLLAGARASVSASLRETSSLALAESLAAGCPVISLDVGTARTHVAHPKVGVVLPLTASADSYADALATVWTPETTALARECVEHQRPRNVALQTVEVYRSVLGDAG